MLSSLIHLSTGSSGDTSSDLSGATLRAYVGQPIPGILRCQCCPGAPYVAEIPDPEVKAYVNVRASIIPSVLDMEVYANVGPSTSLGLGQTNMHDTRYKCRACKSTSGQCSY